MGTVAFDVISKINEQTGEAVVYKETTIWKDGTIMNDARCSGVLYRKKGSKYYRRITPNNTISFEAYGGVSDGDETSFTGTDNKAAFDKAFNELAGTGLTLLVSGKFCHSPLVVNAAGFNIKFDNAALICPTPSENDRAWVFSNLSFNIFITGHAKFITPVFTSGEQRHALWIAGNSIRMDGDIVLQSGGGDGLYIGAYNSTTPPSNIYLKGIKTNACRRNGISLITGVNIVLDSPVCENTNGAWPKSGIDIEPNSVAGGQLQGIRILKPITRNNAGYGIIVVPVNILNTTDGDKVVDITIEDHLSEADGWGTLWNGNNAYAGGFAITGNSYAYPIVNRLLGRITYARGVIKNSGGPGFYFESWDPAKLLTVDVDVKIINPACVNSGASAHWNSGVLIFAGTGATFATGNLNLNCNIRDTRLTPLMFVPIYVYNTVADVEGVSINADIDSNYVYVTSAGVVVQPKGFKKSAIVYKPNVQAYNLNTTPPAAATPNFLGRPLKLTGAISFSLPTSSQVEGNAFYLKSVDSAAKQSH